MIRSKILLSLLGLLAAGVRPPAIGLFFDTNLYATILPERPELSNLTTDDGIATAIAPRSNDSRR